MEFHSILIRIIEINRFAHAVIGRTLQWKLRRQHLLERPRQRRPTRINKRRVIKPGRGSRRWRTSKALPVYHAM